MKSKIISISGRGLGQSPFHPKCFTLSSPLCSLNTKRQGFTLEKDYCPSHRGCVLGGKETQVYVTDETYSLFQVVSLLVLCVSNRILLYSSTCLFPYSERNPTAPWPAGCSGFSRLQPSQQARSWPGRRKLHPALPSLNWE